jgi:hypothetical protein
VSTPLLDALTKISIDSSIDSGPSSTPGRIWECMSTILPPYLSKSVASEIYITDAKSVKGQKDKKEETCPLVT